MCDINLFRNVIAFTNRNLSKRPYLEQIEKICSCHPKALVLREKDLPEKEYCMLAESVIKICKQYKVNCIIHNYIDTALKMNCNSIHLPLHILEKYHMYLKEFETIGTSVHSIQEAQKAEGSRSHGGGRKAYGVGRYSPNPSEGLPSPIFRGNASENRYCGRIGMQPGTAHCR